MTRSHLPLATLALAAALGVAACAGTGVAAPPSDDPGAKPTPSPVVTPPPSQGPVITPAPTRPPTDGMPIKVDLDNVAGDDIYVDIVDKSGRIVRAVSGTPGDGASVAPYELRIEQVDGRTLRVTWSDLGGDKALALYVDQAGTGWILVQPESGDVDAMATDRVLILEFADEVSADEIRATLQDGLDS